MTPLSRKKRKEMLVEKGRQRERHTHRNKGGGVEERNYHHLSK